MPPTEIIIIILLIIVIGLLIFNKNGKKNSDAKISKDKINNRIQKLADGYIEE